MIYNINALGMFLVAGVMAIVSSVLFQNIHDNTKYAGVTAVLVFMVTAATVDLVYRKNHPGELVGNLLSPSKGGMIWFIPIWLIAIVGGGVGVIGMMNAR